MVIEMVSFPIKNGGYFHSYVFFTRGYPMDCYHIAFKLATCCVMWTLLRTPIVTYIHLKHILQI